MVGYSIIKKITMAGELFYQINENSEERVLLNEILKRLCCVANAVTPSGDMKVDLNPITASSFTSATATGSGTIPANALSWTVVNYGAAAGTFNGASLPVGQTLSSANFPLTLSSTISYDATGTTFRIDYYL
jgi:hypothetical protein